MEFVVIWVLVGLFASREAIPDLTAAFKGNTPPSHERRMKRLEARGVNTENDKQPGTLREALRSTVKNAEDRAALRREAKHAGKLQWLDENKDRLSEESYNKIKARNERKQAVVSGFAKAKRLVTDAPERLREAKAWRRNASEPDLLDRDDWHPDDEVPAKAGTDPEVTDETAGEQPSDGQDATVLEFKRAEPSGSSQDVDSVDSDSADSTQPGPNPDEHVVLNPDWDPDSTDPMHPTHGRMITQGELNRRREQEDREALEAERERERAHERALAQAANQTAGKKPDVENTNKTTPSTKGKGTTMAEQTAQPAEQQPVQQPDEPSYETTGLTATLERVKASSRACHKQVVDYDQKLSELQSEHDALGRQIEGLEAQIATLQHRKNTGEQIRALQQAQEQLSSAQDEVAEQITHATNGLSTYQAAAASFDEAHAALSRQLPGQDFYAATADAGDKEFLTQG